MPNTPYYIKKQAGFYTQPQAEKRPLFIYQPTPEGVMVLCEHYSNKYNIHLECVDLRGKIKANDSLDFFRHLQNNPHLLAVDEGQSKGLLLSHAQDHAIPVLVTKDAGQHHIVVFDSSSGPCIKGYFKMAALFPDSQFHLNNGTRQSDAFSCITDGICILKEALQIETLIPAIQSRAIPNHPEFAPSRFSTLTRPDNFYVFRMPEMLLLTAQISDYLKKADADQAIIVRGGESLEHYRNHFSMNVVLSKGGTDIHTNINGYLYVKSLEHQNILDYALTRQKFSALMTSLELNGLSEEFDGLSELAELSHINSASPHINSPSLHISLSPSKLSFFSIAATQSPTPKHNFRHLNFSR